MSAALATSDIRLGDVLDIPLGAKQEIDRVVIHDIHAYDTGDLSIRFRYLSNPRGIDWSGFVGADKGGIRLVSRGVARVDEHIRSLLPG